MKLIFLVLKAIYDVCVMFDSSFDFVLEGREGEGGGGGR